MSRFVRLYPRAWQDRYGDELEALLEDRPPGPYDVLDLLLGAIDAHLHLRDLNDRLDHGRGILMSLRLSGLAAMVGGALWIGFFTIAAVSYTGADMDVVWFPVALGAGVSLLVALAGLSAFQFRHHPRRMWVAFVVPAIGTGLVLLALGRTLLTGDWSYDGGSVGAAILYAGLATVLLGSIVFAAVSRAPLGARVLGPIAMAVGTGIALLGLFGAVPPLGLGLGGLLFGGGWISIGLDAIRRDRSVLQAQPS